MKKKFADSHVFGDAPLEVFGVHCRNRPVDELHAVLSVDLLQPTKYKRVPDLLDCAVDEAMSVLGSMSSRDCSTRSASASHTTAALRQSKVCSPLPPSRATSITSPFSAFSHSLARRYLLPSCTRLRWTFQRPNSFSIESSSEHVGSGETRADEETSSWVRFAV